MYVLTTVFIYVCMCSMCIIAKLSLDGCHWRLDGLYNVGTTNITTITIRIIDRLGFHLLPAFQATGQVDQHENRQADGELHHTYIRDDLSVEFIPIGHCEGGYREGADPGGAVLRNLVE